MTEIPPVVITPRHLLVLETLMNCENSLDLDTLHKIVGLRGEHHLDRPELNMIVVELAGEGLIRAQDGGWAALWCITAKGTARLIAAQAHDVFKPAAAEDQPRVTCCRHREPKPPATALILLVEDELDDWWASLDVELKADAFAQFTLRFHDCGNSHVYVEPTISVPVTGTIGTQEAQP